MNESRASKSFKARRERLENLSKVSRDAGHRDRIQSNAERVRRQRRILASGARKLSASGALVRVQQSVGDAGVAAD
jgi:hypothetical protein